MKKPVLSWAWPLLAASLAAATVDNSEVLRELGVQIESRGE